MCIRDSLSPVHFTLTDLFAPLKLESALIADSNAAAIAVFEEYVFAGRVIVPELVPSTFIEKVFPLETVRLLLEEISVATSPLQPETGVKNALSLPFSPPSIKTSLPKVLICMYSVQIQKLKSFHQQVMC